MPVRAENRFQVGEPYYLYDVVAELNHNGIYEKVVMVDREETLKKIRPYLMMG